MEQELNTPRRTPAQDLPHLLPAPSLRVCRDGLAAPATPLSPPTRGQSRRRIRLGGNERPAGTTAFGALASGIIGLARNRVSICGETVEDAASEVDNLSREVSRLSVVERRLSTAYGSAEDTGNEAIGKLKELLEGVLPPAEVNRLTPLMSAILQAGESRKQCLESLLRAKDDRFNTQIRKEVTKSSMLALKTMRLERDIATKQEEIDSLKQELADRLESGYRTVVQLESPRLTGGEDPAGTASPRSAPSDVDAGSHVVLRRLENQLSDIKKSRLRTTLQLRKIATGLSALRTGARAVQENLDLMRMHFLGEVGPSGKFWQASKKMAAKLIEAMRPPTPPTPDEAPVKRFRAVGVQAEAGEVARGTETEQERCERERMEEVQERVRYEGVKRANRGVSQLREVLASPAWGAVAAELPAEIDLDGDLVEVVSDTISLTHCVVKHAERAMLQAELRSTPGSGLPAPVETLSTGIQTDLPPPPPPSPAPRSPRCLQPCDAMVQTLPMRTQEGPVAAVRPTLVKRVTSLAHPVAPPVSPRARRLPATPKSVVSTPRAHQRPWTEAAQKPGADLPRPPQRKRCEACKHGSGDSPSQPARRKRVYKVYCWMCGGGPYRSVGSCPGCKSQLHYGVGVGEDKRQAVLAELRRVWEKRAREREERRTPPLPAHAAAATAVDPTSLWPFPDQLADYLAEAGSDEDISGMFRRCAEKRALPEQPAAPRRGRAPNSLPLLLPGPSPDGSPASSPSWTPAERRPEAPPSRVRPRSPPKPISGPYSFTFSIEVAEKSPRHKRWDRGRIRGPQRRSAPSTAAAPLPLMGLGPTVPPQPAGPPAARPPRTAPRRSRPSLPPQRRADADFASFAAEARRQGKSSLTAIVDSVADGLRAKLREEEEGKRTDRLRRELEKLRGTGVGEVPVAPTWPRDGAQHPRHTDDLAIRY